MLDRAAFFQVGLDACHPEGLVADLFGQADGLGPAFDHPPGVDAVHGTGCELAMPLDGVEEVAFPVGDDA